MRGRDYDPSSRDDCPFRSGPSLKGREGLQTALHVALVFLHSSSKNPASHAWLERCREESRKNTPRIISLEAVAVGVSAYDRAQ